MRLSDLVIPPQARLALALGAAVACFGAGWMVHGWEQSAAQLHAVKVEQKHEAKATQAVAQAATTYEAVRTANDEAHDVRQVQIRTIFRDVPAPAADCAAPDAVVRLLDGAVASANAAASGGPVDLLPGPSEAAAPPR